MQDSAQSPLQRLTSGLDLARAGLRIAFDLPKLLPNSGTHPSSLLEAWARRTPDGAALAWHGERYTWRQVNERANQYASWFAGQGVRQGEVVALVMDNRPDFLFALHGLDKLGAIASLINHNLTGTALAHALRVCDARNAVVGWEHVAAVDSIQHEVEALAERDLWVVADPHEAAPDDPRIVDDEVARASAAQIDRGYQSTPNDTFCYIYTSGTTGLPKAAIIPHRRILTGALGFGRLMFRSDPSDVLYVTLPLYHSSAMFLGWGSCLGTGSCMALRRKFSASSFWNDVRGYGATGFLYIGELCRYLLNSPVQPGERDHRLRVGVGNGMRPDIWEAFQERFHVPLIREFYGATEGTSAVVNLEGRPGMIGRMTPGLVIARCDQETGELQRNADGHCDPVGEGEIGLLLSRISAISGYDGYVDKQASEKKILRNVFKAGDTYFDTGDLIQRHPDKWLSFADRVGDTFRWKGENVSTNEVAEILNAAGSVLEANVYGVQVPNADGRAGMAALTVEEGFDLEAFASYVAESLPKYQRPLFVRILSGGMRVTGTFKHQKVDYRREGFDPSASDDPLFLLRDGRYAPLDAELYALIEKGEIVPG